MKPLHMRLQQTRDLLGTPWNVLERDYLLSWILAGIARTESLGKSLAFKGGTALKKCYFGHYRFSEDLDFTAMTGAPAGAALERAMQDACAAAVDAMDEYAPVSLSCERYTERDPHPGNQEAFTLRAQLPWQRGPQTRAMVEVTFDENVLLPVRFLPVIHEYGEPLAAAVTVYSLEEIVAEKLRALLQHADMLRKRGWSRSRARDYYDLWRILSSYAPQMDLAGFPPVLVEKCAARGMKFNGPGDFFEPAMVAYVEQTWHQWLGQLVPDLPPFASVMEELRPRIFDLVDAG